MCTTDSSSISLYKNRACAEEWPLGGEWVSNCTTEDIKPSDIIKDCKDLHKELEFHKVLKSGVYKDKGIDDFVKIRGVPIEVVIKKGGKGDRINHCSKFKFSE